MCVQYQSTSTHPRFPTSSHASSYGHQYVCVCVCVCVYYLFIFLLIYLLFTSVTYFTTMSVS